MSLQWSHICNMRKCLPLTSGRFPLLLLRPCGQCETWGARQWAPYCCLWPSGGAEPGSPPAAAPALTLSLPWPINGALSLRSLFLLTWEEGGDTRERGVTQKSRLRLKRPIVFPLSSRGVESQVQWRRRRLCE